MKYLMFAVALLVSMSVSAATLQFRSGTVLAAELSTTQPQILSSAKIPELTRIERKCYAVLFVRLTQGRSISTEDFSLSCFGKTYRCVAVAANDETFDALTWEIQTPSPKKIYRMLFVLDGTISGNAATENIEVKSNAPGNYPTVTVPFKNRKAMSFSRVAQLPKAGQFEAPRP